MAIPSEIYIDDQKYYSYATVEEADIYFKAKFGSTWAGKEELTKQQLLITATRLIDARQYAGAKLEVNQPLQFPRQFKSGNVSDDDLVMACCYEIADSLGTSGGSGNIDSSMLSGVKSYKVGDVDVTMKDDAEIKITSQDDIIDDMLKPYLSDVGGAKIWL